MEGKKIADNHGKKHTSSSNKVDAKNVKSKNKSKKKREVMKNWGNVAGFNEKYTKYYYQALAEAVAVMKDSSNITAHFVDFGEIVGIDKGSDKHGEETEVVELYGNVGGTGEFHMRPKARSKIDKEAIILRVSEYRQKKSAEKEKKEVKHKERQANEKDKAALISLAAQFLDDVAPGAAKKLVDTIFFEAEEQGLSAERIKDRVIVFASIINVVSNLEEDFFSDNLSSLPMPVPKLQEGGSIRPELTMGEVDFLKMIPNAKTTTFADSKETGIDDLASTLAKANEIREQAFKEKNPEIAIKLLRQSYNECSKFSESSDAEKMCTKIKYNIFQIGLYLMINKESRCLSDANKFDEALDLLDRARHLVSDNYDYNSKMKKKWTQKVLNRIKELDTEYRHKKIAFIPSGEKGSIKNLASKSDSKQESKTSAVATYTELNVPDDDSCLFWSVALGVLIPLLNDEVTYRNAFRQLFVTQGDAQDDALFAAHGAGLKARIQAFTATNDTSLIEKQSEDDPLYQLINHYFRQKVASYIAANPQVYTDAMLGRTNEAYVTALRSPNFWGGHIEMHAIFRLLGGNYQLEVEGATGNNFLAAGKPIINIVFVNAEKVSSDPQNHYNVRMPTLFPVAIPTKDSKPDDPLKSSQNREKSVLGKKGDKGAQTNNLQGPREVPLPQISSSSNSSSSVSIGEQFIPKPGDLSPTEKKEIETKNETKRDATALSVPKRILSFISQRTVCIFDNEKSIGTGILLGPNLILTAGHCIDIDNSYCYTEEDGSLIMKSFADYHQRLEERNYEYSPEIDPDVEDRSLTEEELNRGLQAKINYLTAEALAGCLSSKLTIVCAQHSETLDFALLRSETPFPNIAPISISKNAEPSDELYIIHHPNGEPQVTSIARRIKGNEVSEFKIAYIANTGVCSSGAGVFNSTGQLVAIHNDRPLIKEDYKEDGEDESIDADVEVEAAASLYEEFDLRDKPLGGTLIKEIIKDKTTQAAIQFCKEIKPFLTISPPSQLSFLHTALSSSTTTQNSSPIVNSTEINNPPGTSENISATPVSSPSLPVVSLGNLASSTDTSAQSTLSSSSFSGPKS